LRQVGSPRKVCRDIAFFRLPIGGLQFDSPLLGCGLVGGGEVYFAGGI
jgi:hypothetical protein